MLKCVKYVFYFCKCFDFHHKIIASTTYKKQPIHPKSLANLLIQLCVCVCVCVYFYFIFSIAKERNTHRGVHTIRPTVIMSKA
jgi:hypothetical protein